MRLRTLSMLFSALMMAAFLMPSDVSAAPPKSSSQIRFVWSGGKKYVYIKDVASYYGMTFKYGKDGCEMSSKYSRVWFTYNKRFGSINGTVVNFLFAPLLQGMEPVLSEQDFFLVLDPVIRSRSLPRQKVKIVMIDPGHGGDDNGASGKRNREKHLTLAMAKELKAALLAKGFSVILTRETDKTLPLESRAALCRKVKPDMFISIHCNAAGDKSISGIETFALTPAGAPSTCDSTPGFNSSTGNKFDKSNYRLAFEIQDSLVGAVKSDDRGVKHARFYVLKNSVAPSVLVEVGFLSNAREEYLLSLKDRQKTIASAIASAVVKYVDAAK